MTARSAAGSGRPLESLGTWIAALSFSALIVVSTMSSAQTTGCDEGVIRLPDRSGTIQICSALAARAPELARQLTQATAQLGSQQAQIAELTRLVRGLNNVSRNIGAQRQAEMLQTLSAELEKAQRDRGGDALVRINERLDGLQASLLGALSDPKTASALGEALKGPVGEAIAKLDLSGASRQIEDIGERLKALQAGVADVRSDTTAIRQQLAQIEQRQQAADGARQQRDEITVDLLKRLSGEIRELGQRGGLIDNPRTYSAHYHNARILAQRGETDLAMASYRQVFRTGVQMADPVIDLTTLLVRQYGRQGAARALARDFQKDLPDLSYLYALQLLADRELDEVEALLFEDARRVADFPPLATIYLKRLHERLARDRKDRINIYTFQWSDVTGMGRVAEAVDREIERGNYLAFFIDQVRAGRDLDDFRSVSDAFARDRILKVTVPRLSGSERLAVQTADLARSPVVLDYTYFFDPPSSEVLSDLTRRAAFMPRYKPGSIFLFIWDAALDPQKPIRICGMSSGAEQCRDINAPSLRCSDRVGDRAIDCLMTRSIGSDRFFPPFVEAHLIAQDVPGPRCLSKVTYSTTRGRDIVIDGRHLIGVFRRAADPEIDRVMGACGYDLQTRAPDGRSGRDGRATLSQPPAAAFAAAVKSDTPVAYTRENCERVGYHNRTYGVLTLAGRRMDNYLLKIAQTMNTLPELPTAQPGGFTGQFDEADGKCKLRLVISGVPHACAIERIVRNRWLPAAPASGNTMASVGDAWNSGVYPDAASTVQCVAQEDKTAESRRQPPRKARTVDQLELLEASGIDHELETLGAGHGPGCDTQGYSNLIYRIGVDLGLRAFEMNVCTPANPLRKAKLEAGQRASAQRLNGCFTAAGMTAYSTRAEQWLATAGKDCAGPAGRQLKTFMEKAAEWAVEQS